ncbi:LIGHT-DEPENDENT SHORT HYPOCOTYLS-like protein (DUF640) [Rhynchospora pubera]|uniref:LIGHT-DEPENDENT SHORT HYPOCOTYLS-like protein (DUF640) n=1 Tax=Rhynchospora pubera TaxID=906938 RepID=A0AAV8DVU0_9POAL|nr:LIGHT-DEPENDENT SHORT HYPOCOTYLS-like protein (DUF640) [Rhynchospora pubera]
MDPAKGTGGTASASTSAGATTSSAGGAEAPSSSSTAPALQGPQPLPQQPAQLPSRYESQKRRDWNTFLQYLRNHKPPLTLQRCSGAHVIEFLKYLDQFGKTKVHVDSCPHFGKPNPPEPCACPLKQAWGSLDALIGRLRAAYEESGGRPESNPFAARAVRMYLREVREFQAKARGIPYEKKKRKRAPPDPPPGSSGTTSAPPESSAALEEAEPSEDATQEEDKPFTGATASTTTTAAAAASAATRTDTSSGGTAAGAKSVSGAPSAPSASSRKSKERAGSTSGGS